MEEKKTSGACESRFGLDYSRKKEQLDGNKDFINYMKTTNSKI